MLYAFVEKRVNESRAKSAESSHLDVLRSEWFDEQRSFYTAQEQLSAAICSRRAGKTRGGNEADVFDAAQTQHGRFLYINETRGEAKKLAWTGARGDGMASLVRRHKLPAVCNESELTIHFPAIDSWIYLVGVDDDRAIMKALGLPYTRVRWDEAQKIPPKFTETIRETLMPTLLDYGGQLKFTGTPDRKMNGLFFEITRPEPEKRLKGWRVDEWTLMDNPYWGRALQRGDGRWDVVWGWKNDRVSGPHTDDEVVRAVRECRHLKGVIGLQKLLGGPEVAPLDSPIMRRQAGGQWVYEDASFVYHVHKVRQDWLTFAPARMGSDGFIDLEKALADLPGWPNREYFMALGGDLGTFGLVVWAWSAHDPVLYELGSFKKPGLNYDEHAAYIARVREKLHIGVMTADAGGGGKQAVMGWSRKFVERYGQPIIEATKHHKNFAIGQFNTDLESERIRVREGGEWLKEAKDYSWSSIVNSKGEKVPDPTSGPCHVLDAGLYAHRESYHFRNTPDDRVEKLKMTVEQRRAIEARELEQELEEDRDAWLH